MTFTRVKLSKHVITNNYQQHNHSSQEYYWGYIQSVKNLSSLLYMMTLATRHGNLTRLRKGA